MKIIASPYDRVITARHKQERKKQIRHLTSWSSRWPAPHYGRWWKRKLSKARRRYAKMTLRGIRYKEPTGIESEVNWRTW